MCVASLMVGVFGGGGGAVGRWVGRGRIGGGHGQVETALLAHTKNVCSEKQPAVVTGR
jgi:hypothetical protein